MKKILIISTILFLLLPYFALAAETQPVYLTIFYGDGCPHCHDELLYLDILRAEFPNLIIRKLEVWSDVENARLMSKTGQAMSLKISGVPLTIIGNEAISGYFNDKITGARIRSIVTRHSEIGCSDTVGQLSGESPGLGSTECRPTSTSTVINLPFLGTIDFADWSLPLLTILIAALDSLNPCAMWVLLFLISLLFGMENRLKMWILGGLFLLTSVFSYFIFLAAWLNVFLFLGFIYYIRISVGIFAILSGIFYLRQWWREKNGGCHVTNQDQRRKIMDSLRSITQQKTIWLALIGMVALAFVVNLIELVCSAGLPAIYTQVLALANLPPWRYYLFLLLYVFVYILPSLLVFIVAMKTMRAFGLSTKYARWSNLIGGIVILLLGIMLIFRPSLIMFG